MISVNGRPARELQGKKMLFLTNDRNDPNARRNSVVEYHSPEQPRWDLSLFCLLDDKLVVEYDIGDISCFKFA